MAALASPSLRLSPCTAALSPAEASCLESRPVLLTTPLSQLSVKLGRYAVSVRCRSRHNGGPASNIARQRTRQRPVRTHASSGGEATSSPDTSASQSSDIPSSVRRSRIAVFVSGGGSNFRAIHAACVDGRVNADVVVVVSDKPECAGCQYAKDHGMPTLTFPANAKQPSLDALSPEQLIDAMRHHRVDYILLAGYLRLLPSDLVNAFPRAILNIHPALLPSFGGKGFYGMRVHQAVIASGARVSGPTVHFVDERYDHGPIIAQQVVPVLPFDSPKDLQARVLAQEHQLYARVLAALCDGSVEWREDGVPIIKIDKEGMEYQ